MRQTWVVLSPAGVPARREPAATGGVTPAGVAAPAWRPAGGPLRLAFLSNRKPNTAELQRGLGEALAAAWGDRLAIAGYFEKASAALGAPEEVLEAVAAAADVVVNGVGD
ncbi:MAG: hypothetical protein IRY95_05960 [Clostridia bacterium]|nr:hypothetical protein [Clostridia bacterium]